MDTLIPRPKMPKQALPDSIRKKLGFTAPRPESKHFLNSDVVEISREIYETKGGQEARQYLKMKSGVAMSERTSGAARTRHLIPRSMAEEGEQRGSRQPPQQQQQLAVLQRREKKAIQQKHYGSSEYEPTLDDNNNWRGVPMKEIQIGSIDFDVQRSTAVREKYRGTKQQGEVGWK